MKHKTALKYATDLDLVQQATLDDRSRHLRRLIFRAIENGGRGHIGPALSLVEIIRVLYDDFLRHDPAKPAWRERDRFILSKGHGCLALYAVLADKGFFAVGELDRFCHFDSFLGGHPETVVPGVEASTGALGHGLSIGLGMALAARMTGRDSKVYVLMGDGEINEGSVWEAAACADKHRLSNLTAIIDYNKIQSAGSVFEIQNMEPLADKWTRLRLPRVRVQRPRRRRPAAGLPRSRCLRRRPAARGHLPHGQGQGHSRRREQSRLAPQVRPQAGRARRSSAARLEAEGKLSNAQA